MNTINELVLSKPTVLLVNVTSLYFCISTCSDLRHTKNIDFLPELSNISTVFVHETVISNVADINFDFHFFPRLHRHFNYISMNILSVTST